MKTQDTGKYNISDEKLNLFIDEQLAKGEMDEIQEALLDDKQLRERVCQLRAVRELVAYAYDDAPRSRMDRRINTRSRFGASGIAASVFLLMGALVGWFGHTLAEQETGIASSRQVFEYYTHNIPASHAGRKIVVHVSTGDLMALKNALDETEQLLESYHDAGSPISIDIIANKEGINLLRTGVTPYADRIEKMVNGNENVQFFACARSIDKAKKKEGRDFAMLPQAQIARPARELIPERLDKGWIYIKV